MGFARFAPIVIATLLFAGFPAGSRAQAPSPTPVPTPTPPRTLYLDGVALASPIGRYLSGHRKPDEVSDLTYRWENRQGGSLSVTTDADGTVVLIDVTAGPREVRSVDVLGRLLRFNDGGHINEPPPVWVPYGVGDPCGPRLKGSPCWGYLLPGGNELVMNFGGDNGTADWDLTEVFLGRRAALMGAKVVVSRSSVEAASPWPTPSKSPERQKFL